MNAVKLFLLWLWFVFKTTSVDFSWLWTLQLLSWALGSPRMWNLEARATCALPIQPKQRRGPFTVLYESGSIALAQYSILRCAPFGWSMVRRLHTPGHSNLNVQHSSQRLILSRLEALIVRWGNRILILSPIIQP